MLSSKIKKIVGFSFLVFFLTSLVLPFGIVLAQEKPTPTITLERYVNQQSGTNGFWMWGLTVETTNVENGAKIWAWLYELQNGEYKIVDSQTSNQTLVVTDNYTEYTTPFILVPGSTYTVKMLLVGTNISKQYGPEKIPEGGEVSVIGGGGSSGGGSAPSINVQSLVCFPMNYNPNDQTPLEGKWWFKVLDNEYTATRFKGPYNDEDECKKSIQEIYYKPA
ncbi:hypothetical protein KKB58_01890, partial [Patescibacteria group bacterium]|nr:hypothetical protein [Patescibacteria group bacterium]